MQQLKNKLFGVLAGDIRISDFEQWLYTNTTLLNSIDEDPFVFNIYNLNYKSDTILHTIDNICKKMEGEEGYIISIVERECRKILKTENEEIILKSMYKLIKFYTFNYERELLSAFYYLNDDIALYKEGYVLKFDLVEEAQEVACEILNKLKHTSLEEKKELLMKGIPKRQMPENSLASKKQWYQFWK